jgi:hypothetical protein
MAAPSVTHTFTNGTTADATQVNQNFTDVIDALTDGTSDLTFNQLTANGAATFNGAVTLGNATSDDITITGRVASDIDPKTASANTLGDATQLWAGVYADNIYASRGLVGTPGFAFHADTDTGIFSSGANLIEIVNGGTQALGFGASQLATFGGRMVIQDGTTALPSIYSSTGTSDTGISMSVADQVHISCAGNEIVEFAATYVQYQQPIRIPAGSASAPSIYSTTGTSDTGIYMNVADQVHIGCAGSEVAEFSGSAVTLTGVDLTLTAGVVTATNTGNNKTALLTGDHSSEYVAHIRNSNSSVTSDANVMMLQFSGDAAPDTDAVLIDFRNSSASMGELKVTGSGTGVDLVSASDERLKTGFKPIENAIPRLLESGPTGFFWKKGGAFQEDFVAQKLHKVNPLAVKVGGEDPEQDPWRVSKAAMVPLLTQGFIDFYHLFEKQEVRVRELERRLSRYLDS